MQTNAQCLLDSVLINALLVDPSGTDFNYDTNGDGSVNSNDEYVEICNISSDTVDISLWRIGDDDPPPFPDFQIPDSTSLLPGACLLLVVNYCPSMPPEMCDSPPGVLNMAYEFSGFLGNAGDVISLVDTLGNSCSVVYGSTVCSQIDLLDIPDFDPNTCDDWGGDIDGCPLLSIGDSCDYEPSVLPIEFIEAQVSLLKENYVLVKWTVNEAKPNLTYQVEWTSDINESFKTINQQNSQSEELGTRKYEFVHKEPSPELNFYRIKQISNTGVTVISETMVANLPPDDFVIIRPTIVSEGFSLEGNLTRYDMSIWDASGRILMIQNNLANNRFVNVENLNPGMYWARFTSESFSGIVQFVKL